MPAKLTQEEFESRSRAMHGDAYDYSISVYKGTDKYIDIMCKKHGSVFRQEAGNHMDGQGCPLCASDARSEFNRGRKKKHRLIYGVGLCDALTVDENGYTLYSYTVWHNMFKRCYSESYQKKQPTYSGCIVSHEWIKYSDFQKWFSENYIEGFQLDKDILSYSKKVYSPSTCCFVPTLINHIISSNSKTDKRRTGGLPGVTKDKRCVSKYKAQITKYGKHHLIGIYDSEMAAFYAYKKAKEAYIKEVAQDYFDKGLIAERVKDALFRYEVEITD